MVVMVASGLMPLIPDALNQGDNVETKDRSPRDQIQPTFKYDIFCVAWQNSYE
jgi:hypothetical protein